MPAAQALTYYARHRSSILARARQRYVADPAHRERLRATALAHYYAHRAERLASQRAAYQADPAKFIARVERSRGLTARQRADRALARQSNRPLAWASCRLRWKNRAVEHGRQINSMGRP
jgi:hypothetical protein